MADEVKLESIRIGLLQTAPNHQDAAANLAGARDWVEKACSEYRLDLIVLPEFFHTFYFPQYHEVERYWSFAEPLDGPVVSALRDWAVEFSVDIVAGVYEAARAGMHFDTALYVTSRGDIAGHYRKVHAPAISGGYEKLYYTPGSFYTTVRSSFGWDIGLLICYDWRFPEAARCVALQGADLIVFPFATPSMQMWKSGLRTRAWENQVFLAVCNRVGRDQTWTFSGESLIIGPWGDVRAEGGNTHEGIITAELDRTDIFTARHQDFNWRDRRPDTYKSLAMPAETMCLDYPDQRSQRAD